MRKPRTSNWTKVALRLAKAVPVERLHPRVKAWVFGRTKAARGPWFLACSGGADSVALLLLVWAHWPRRREELSVLHFNHGQRGAASRADERFCRTLAGSLGCRYRSGRWAKPKKAAGEAELREVRHAFFREEMGHGDSRALWLGHNADDVVETLFMRLARGSGTSGLAAPRPVQFLDGRVHLRPLLGLSKEAIREALARVGGAWCEDRSNQGDLYLRNRIRLEVVPAWRRAVKERDAIGGASLSRELLEEDDEAMDAWLDELKPMKRGLRLDLAVLKGRPKGLWRRAVRRWLVSIGNPGDLSKRGFDALLEAAMRGNRTRQSMGTEGFAVIDRENLRYVRNFARRTQK